MAALVVGVLCGHFLLGGGSSISLSGKTTLTGDQLDSTIATYTYNGKTVDVTARQVISQSKSVDSAANSDGTYNVPVADDVVSYARNAIVLQAAKDQGISVTDDDLSATPTRCSRPTTTPPSPASTASTRTRPSRPSPTPA